MCFFKARARNTIQASIPMTTDLLEGGYNRNDLSK